MHKLHTGGHALLGFSATRTPETLELECTFPCDGHGVRFSINGHNNSPNRTTPRCNKETANRTAYFSISVGRTGLFNVSCFSSNDASNSQILQPLDLDSTTDSTTDAAASMTCCMVK